jgi:outer membrane lipoprotein-sorting protein
MLKYTGYVSKERIVINKKTWGIIGIVILVSALLVGFFSLQPSAEDILLQTIESMESIADAHAILEFDIDTVEEKLSGTIEIWGRIGEDGPGAFRMEVLEISDEEFIGVMIVSDGETLWAYDPNENKALIGTFDEATEMIKESETFAEKRYDMGGFDEGDYKPPESAEEAIQRLKEYVDIDNTGTATIGDASTYLLKFVPIAEKMPAEFIAVGGYINLWIDKDRSVPLAVEYTGSTMGEGSVTVTSLELNTGLEDALFTFETSPGTEVMTFADIVPQSVSLEEAANSTEFKILAPIETPEGATLVDILEIHGTIVQRYTLPEGGSFTIAQGTTAETTTLPTEAESVEVRGVLGSLFVDEEGGRTLLTWEETDLIYVIAGDLTPDQALLIAESLQ